MSFVCVALYYIQTQDTVDMDWGGGGGVTL